MLNVEDRVWQLRLNHVYNICHGSALSYLHKSFTLRSAVSAQNTIASSNEDFFITLCKANISYCNKFKDINFCFILNIQIISVFKTKQKLFFLKYTLFIWIFIIIIIIFFYKFKNSRKIPANDIKDCYIFFYNSWVYDLLNAYYDLLGLLLTDCKSIFGWSICLWD